MGLGGYVLLHIHVPVEVVGADIGQGSAGDSRAPAHSLQLEAGQLHHGEIVGGHLLHQGVQGRIMDEYCENRLGQTLEVLCTGEEGGYLTGRSYADSPDIDGTVYFTGDCAPGDFAMVRITELMDGELVGEQI